MGKALKGSQKGSDVPTLIRAIQLAGSMGTRSSSKEVRISWYRFVFGALCFFLFLFSCSLL